MVSSDKFKFMQQTHFMAQFNNAEIMHSGFEYSLKINDTYFYEFICRGWGYM